MAILADACHGTRTTSPIGPRGSLTNHPGDTGHVTVEQNSDGTARVILWRDGAEFVFTVAEAVACSLELTIAAMALRDRRPTGALL